MAHEQQQTPNPTQSGEGQGREGQSPEAQGGGNQQGMARPERSTPERYRGGSNPFSMMRRLSDQMDRMFDDFLTRSFGESFLGELGPWAPSRATGSGFWPEVEVSHRDGKLVIQVDLPGLKREDVKVELKENELTISGDRTSQREQEERGFYRSERSYGSFRRTIPLPQGAKLDTASATFESGVLRVEIEAPSEDSRTRRIEVREGKTH